MIIKGKDLIERIKDKEYSEDLLKELEKYEVKKPKTVWELKEDDVIWLALYVDAKSQYVSRESVWFGWENDNYNRETGMAHLTKERAELHARVLNTELAIKKWKRENDNVELDWEDDKQTKYNLMYDYKGGETITIQCSFKLANAIYFSSFDKASQCVEDIGEERIIEWLKWEDNDQ